mmetsp:Transcript_30700/g.36502  ORF Transcript_30700/g.36502 Transcript_30700/m.36502 type:complete len:93 (+) Transcript_30700:98-376(+)
MQKNPGRVWSGIRRQGNSSTYQMLRKNPGGIDWPMTRVPLCSFSLSCIVGRVKKREIGEILDGYMGGICKCLSGVMLCGMAWDRGQERSFVG